MATAKKTQIVITANAAVAKKVMEELQQRIDGIKQKMAALDVTTKQGQREFNKLKKELVSYNSAVSQNVTNTERISKAMKNLSGTSLNELKRALSAAKSELGKMSASDKGLKQMQNNVKALQGQIDKLSGSVHKQSGAWQTAMKNLSAYVGMFALFNKAKELVTGAIKKNFEYSGSLTDIRKVSGLTMDQVKQLSTELAKIDTRTSVDGLAQLAYQGAKLGMSKYGVEGMTQFVKAADKINVALGEELGEEALPALSKMVEVMGLIPRMGIEKAMDATGSAMFKLSTTSTATSNDIVEFSKRLTGVARTAGITTDQLLALGSASSSMMLMPEVASTAFGKFITALQKNHNLIAKELGIPDETIKNLYASGHAMDAMVLVFEKMRDKGNMNALGSIFKDLGSEGQRLVTAMVTMAKNVDMLKDHLYVSEEAFREATAVTNEYEMQQQSAIGILERANNLWEKAFVNPDGVDAVKGMAEWWYEMSQTMTSSPILKGTLLTALQMVLMALKAVATLLPVIIGYMAAQGVYSGLMLIRQYGAALGLAIKELYAYATASRTATAAQVGLNAAQKMNPWVALASVIIALAGVIYGYAQQAREAAKAAAEAERQANAWKDTLGQAAVETSNLNRKLANYKKMMNEANLSQKERQGLISRFNKDFRSYISNLGIEIKSVKDLRDHYSELAQEAQRATYYRMREQAKQQALPKFDADRNSAANALMAQVRALGLDKLGVSFNDIDRWVSKGANGNAVFWYLAKMMPKDKSGLVHGFDWKLDNKGFVYRTNYDGSKIGPSSSDRLMSFKLRDLLSASRWYANATGRRSKKEQEIDKEYANFVPEGYTPYPEETPGTLENDAPDKDAIAQEKRDKRDRERAWREELKQKQDEANAIMDNVRNFYERQINAKMQEAIGLGMDKTEQDLFVEPVRRRMNEALEQVRLAIAGQANTWEQFKLTMKDDLIEQTDETGVNLSEGLLKGITSNNIDALRKKLEGLANSLNRPLNSVLAEVFAKATKNAQANLKLETQQQEARRKAIQEHDYTGVVQQSAYDTFNLLGYANPTDAEVKDKAAFDKRKANIIAMFEKAREEITKVFAADVSTEEGRGLLMKTLFGDDPDGMSKRIAETLGNDAKEWQAFYQKLIQYNDEYESASKKRDDERKKLNDYGWSKSATQKKMQATIDYQQKQNKETSRQYSFGAKGDTILPWEQTEATDPELALLKLKFDLAKEYYKYIEEHGASDEQKIAAAKQIADAHDAIMDSVAAKAKATAEAQMKWYKPIEEYGSALGEALTDESKSVKDATKSMINSFIDLTGEYVQQKLTQWVMTKLYNSLMADSEKELVVERQVAAVEDAQTSVAKAGVDVAAGTASGAAKTIGTLGWWGIPLVAVIGAVLGGLLSLAKGALSDAFGGNKNNNDTKRNFKVTSGMLTYDSGNVQDLRPFVGDDGSLYWATEDNKPHNGVSLLTQPTATTINGQPSLVAENGPELVIGRETTQAMMMNNPQLLKALVNYDRNYSGRRAYDTGNVAESSATIASGTPIPNDVGVSQADTNLALLQAIGTLMQRLNEPIEARIDMYGRGNLYDSMTKANRFMKRK
ncbi:MAG: phage tail tape measure protein [Prevotella sp.]|nr:phage tail tape measure protein [Prevotella sp.]